MRSQVSVKNELYELEKFIKFCVKDDEIAGFNVYCSRHPGVSYVLAKTYNDPEPKYCLTLNLDYAHPLERPLIVDAIHKGRFGVGLDAESLENEMVMKSGADT